MKFPNVFMVTISVLRKFWEGKLPICRLAWIQKFLLGFYYSYLFERKSNIMNRRTY